MARLSEDSLIARYFAPLAGEAGLRLKDDAACLTPRAGHDIVLTADALVAGIHFLPPDPPASIARKALGVNVSDLAAKGASPRGFLLSLGLPPDWTEPWLADFAQGLGAAAREWRCPLLGGDTVKSPGGLVLSITAIGEVPQGRMVRRATARAGDLVCVTGTVGDAALGLAVHVRATPGTPALASLAGDPMTWVAKVEPEHAAFLRDRYLHPQPRIALAEALRAHARAAMDVSDGLAGDLAKMGAASGASAVVEVERVPFSPAAKAALAVEPSLMERILTGGDDYEILCAVPQERLEILSREAQEAGVPLAVIGRIVEGEGLPLFRENGSEHRFEAGSFGHF